MPQHNGIAERANRTVLDMARTMLANADLPHCYWYDAVEWACWVLNVTPSRILSLKTTPYKAFTGKKPDVSRVRPFGTPAVTVLGGVAYRLLGSLLMGC